MAREGLTTSIGELHPGARATGNDSLENIDIAGRFENSQVLTEGRVAHLEAIAQQPELGRSKLLQHGTHPQPHGAVDDLVEPDG